MAAYSFVSLFLLKRQPRMKTMANSKSQREQQASAHTYSPATKRDISVHLICSWFPRFAKLYFCQRVPTDLYSMFYLHGNHFFQWRTKSVIRQELLWFKQNFDRLNRFGIVFPVLSKGQSLRLVSVFVAQGHVHWTEWFIVWG